MTGSFARPMSIIVTDLAEIDYAPFRLPMFVIYKHPLDFPNDFVVRLWDCGRGPCPIATPFALTAPTLEEARAAIPRHWTRIARSEGDDRCIVESYL